MCGKEEMRVKMKSNLSFVRIDMKIYDKLFENVCEEEQNENVEIYCQYMLVIYCRGFFIHLLPYSSRIF